MKKQTKKLLSILLVLVIVIQLMPVSVMAADDIEIVDLEPRQTAKPENLEEETYLEGLDYSEEEYVGEETDGEFEDEVSIIGEEPSRREEYSKQFMLENGLMMAAVYPHAVHFDADGTWEEIDNRLLNGTAEYEAAADPGKAEKEIFSLEDPGEPEEAVEVLPDESVEDIPVEDLEEPDYEVIDLNDFDVDVSDYEIDGYAADETELIEPAASEENSLPEEEQTDGPEENEANSDLEEDPPEEPAESLDEEKDASVTEIIPVTDPVLENTANSLRVMLPETFGEYSRIIVGNKGYTLYFRPEGIASAGAEVSPEIYEPKDHNDELTNVSKSMSSVRYAEAYPGVELRYDLIGTELKESYVIADRESTAEELTTLVYAPGLTPVLHEDGSIEFVAEAQGPVFFVPAPYMYDDGIETGSVKTRLYLMSSGEYRISYIPDKAWLDEEIRTWPVTLDPTIHTTLGPSSIDDSYVTSAHAGTAYPSTINLIVGNAGTSGVCRSFFRINSLPTLKSSDVVVDAKLSYWVNFKSSDPDIQYGDKMQTSAYMVTGDSTLNYSGITWNNKPDLANNRLDADILDFKVNYKNREGYNIFNITRAVNAWYRGTINNGICFISSRENTYLWHYFHAKEHGDTAKQPILELYYINTNGVENYWDYTSVNVGRAGTGMVQNFSGNYVLSRQDLSIDGNRMPAAIGFTYNISERSTDIGYGNGWRNDYTQTIQLKTISGTTYYCWTDGDATDTYFASTNGEWKDEAGNGYVLTIDAAATGTAAKYTITDKKGNKLVFDAYGRLMRIEDLKGNSLTVTYVADSAAEFRILAVEDGAGRVYNFSYTGNLLTEVDYLGTGTTALKSVTYTYSGSNLTGVGYDDGKTVQYTWSGDIMTTASDILQTDGTRDTLSVTYTAGSSYRPGVTTELTLTSNNTQVGELSFSYGENTTAVTDAQGRWVSYQFNNFGNTTAVYNSEGQALYGRWAKNKSTDTGRANQLNASSRLQGTANTAPRSIQLNVNGTPETVALDSYKNLLSNVDFTSNLTGWSGSGTQSGDGRTTQTDSRGTLDSGAILLKGNYAKNKRYSQTVTISGGAAGDIITFGGWVKCAAVDLAGKTYIGYNDSGYVRRAGIQVELKNGNTVVVSKYVPVNADIRYWQFLSGSVTATGAYTKATYTFVYDCNANKAYFDGAQLFREPFEYIYTYDSNGNVETVKDPEGRVTTYTYNSNQDVTSIALPGGATYSYSYNNMRLLEQTVSATSITTNYVYDTYGNLSSTVIHSGSDSHVIQSDTAYTTDGNMVASTTNPARESISYTNNTELSLVTGMTDAQSTTTSYTYDVMRRLTGSSAAGSSVTNTFVDDLLSGITHSNTQNSSTDYSFTYTVGSLPLVVKVGDQTLITNSYNSGTWTLQRQTYGNGDYWANTYNTADELTKRYTNVTDTLGIGFELVYNSKGMLMQVQKKAVTISGDSVTWGSLLGTENYVYDAYDRLIRTIRTDGSYNLIGESNWTLDNNDNVTALTSRYVVNGTLQTRTYNYTYNADQQPTQTTYSTIKETIGYDGFGRRSEKDVYNSDVVRLQTQYAYRNVDATYTTEQIAQLTHTYNNTTLTHAYTYDANGNILTDTVNGDTTEYTYDALNRLTWEKNAAAELAWQYAYDLGGNILSKTEYTYVNGITSNPQTITYTYGDSDWPDLLTSWGNQSIIYDGIGNPTNYMGSTMEWQGGRQLKGMTRGNNILSFAYNDSGLRTEKTVAHANSGPSETKQYVWNGSRLVAEIGEEYSFYFHYNAAGEMIGFTYRIEATADESEHIFVKNQQGDVEKVLRAWDQAVVAEYSYDAWGNPIDWSGPMAEINPIRYRSYYYDTETGFYYLQSRYYDPQTGRFINADGQITTGQGLMSYNMFAYCSDNPACFIDNNGAKPEYVLDIDEDGEDDCFVYSYSYTTGAFWWKKEHKGYVYLYRGVNKDFFEDKNNWPEGFNTKSDLMVGDYTGQSNPNLYAYQAQKVKRSHRKAIVGLLFEYVSDYSIPWNRTEQSVLSEWKNHKVFAFASPRAQNVDFDEKEEGKNFGYYLKKAWLAFLN